MYVIIVKPLHLDTSTSPSHSHCSSDAKAVYEPGLCFRQHLAFRNAGVHAGNVNPLSWRLQFGEPAIFRGAIITYKAASELDMAIQDLVGGFGLAVVLSGLIVDWLSCGS